MLYVYAPVWTEPRRWTQPYHLDRYRWLGRELSLAAARDAILARPRVRRGFLGRQDRGLRAAGANRLGVSDPGPGGSRGRTCIGMSPPSIPAYWTTPPETARRLKADPSFIRVFGDGDKHSGEPGYASEPIDFLSARDALDWSLPAAWGLRASKGETPMIPRRLLDYFDAVKIGAGRLDIESVSHVVTGRNLRARFRPSEPVGSAFIHRNPDRAPPGPAGRPPRLRGDRGRGGQGDRSLGNGEPQPADRGGSHPAALAIGRGLGHGPDRHGLAGACRGRDRILRSRLPGPGRHVRSRLVGDRGRHSGADPSRLRGLPGRRASPGPSHGGLSLSSRRVPPRDWRFPPWA